MKRLAWFSAVLAAFLASSLGLAQVGAPVAGAPTTATAAITSGNVPFDVSTWDIPVIDLGSGSIGNNGALTITNALTTTYANAYFIVPAGAVATGVPAAKDIYFGQCSSTTACTLFNNLLSANLSSVGAPQIPASPTAFVTTGPGAYTGNITTTTMVTITIPAGTMGASGECWIEPDFEMVSAATNKAHTVTFGGTNVLSITQTTVTNFTPFIHVKNRGSQAANRSNSLSCTSGACSIRPSIFSSINTANAVAVGFLFQKDTATESGILQGGRVACKT